MIYDAVLFLSFGGPESREEVIPFLENVLGGRNVPRQRIQEVAEHYYHFGGRSPINGQNRVMIERLKEELRSNGPDLPVYWGNRNWRPFLTETMRQMTADRVKRAIAFVTSAYSSYSGCRQYREDIQRAREAAGEGAPEIDKIRAFFGEPGFLDPIVENVSSALANFSKPLVLFTAHSIPTEMAESSDYERQIREASSSVVRRLELTDWSVAYQSRSGPPSQPWLRPDTADVLRETPATEVVLVPIGFLSDHMEVIYDLDVEAAEICRQRGIAMGRASTVGTDSRFIRLIRDLIVERNEVWRPDACRPNCCLRGR